MRDATTDDVSRALRLATRAAALLAATERDPRHALELRVAHALALSLVDELAGLVAHRDAERLGVACPGVSTRRSA